MRAGQPVADGYVERDGVKVHFTGAVGRGQVGGRGHRQGAVGSLHRIANADHKLSPGRKSQACRTMA
jgi:hypothetical protein